MLIQLIKEESYQDRASQYGMTLEDLKGLLKSLEGLG